MAYRGVSPGRSNRGNTTSHGLSYGSPRGNTTSHGLSYGTPGGFGGSDPRNNPNTFRGNDIDRYRQQQKQQQQNRDSDGERRRREAAAKEAARLEAARQAALSSRDAAANTMMAAIKKAYGDAYGTDYMQGRYDDYYDEYDDSLTEGYDSALRGIYAGFREAGLLDADQFNTQKAALDTQRGVETTRLGDLARGYQTRVQSAIDADKAGVLADLGKLYGGDVSTAQAQAQQKAIEGFTYDTDYARPLYLSEGESAPEFFTDFRKEGKVGYGVETRPGQAAAPEGQASGRMSRSMGITNPVARGSLRIIG